MDNTAKLKGSLYKGYDMRRDPSAKGPKVTITLDGAFIGRRISFTAAMRTIDKLTR